MKKKIVSILCSLLCSVVLALKPILDGRLSPIFLETRYTFSNFEWARGFVHFKRGFDLPIGGTAILDITEPVENGITFSNSTLMMQGNLALSLGSTINGIGFIDGQNNTLFFRGNQFFDVGEQFTFISNIVIEGNLDNVFRPGSAIINFTQLAFQVIFKNITLREPFNSNFITEQFAPGNLQFRNSRIILTTGQRVMLHSNVVTAIDLEIQGVRGAQLECINELRSSEFGVTLVNPGITLYVNNIGSAEATGGIILDNAKLSYTSTDTSQLMFTSIYQNYPGRGRITCKGPCELEAPVGTDLLLQENSVLQMESSARLSLSPGINLRVF